MSDMSDIATVPAADPKPKRISKRLQEAIRLLTTPECKTQRAAAQKLGMSETYLSEALRKPEIQVFMARQARETIAQALPRAAARLVELIDAGSEHVSADIAKHVAAIGGIKPAYEQQLSVNIDLRAGFVIDISEPTKPVTDAQPMRTVGDNRGKAEIDG